MSAVDAVKAYSGGRCTWFPGHLSWYESMSSLGAKFGFTNQFNAATVGKVLKRFGAGNPVRTRGGLVNVWATVDSFDVAAFSQYIGEEQAILQSQSLRALQELPNEAACAADRWGKDQLGMHGAMVPSTKLTA